MIEGSDADAGRKVGDSCALGAVRGIKVGGQIDEVGDADGAVVIQITFLPGDGGAAGIEIRSQVDEVGDADRAVEVQIADAGQTDLDVRIAVDIVNPRQADAGAGVEGLAGIVNALGRNGMADDVGILYKRPKGCLGGRQISDVNAKCIEGAGGGGERRSRL